jgi:hypothetical protein
MLQRIFCSTLLSAGRRVEHARSPRPVKLRSRCLPVFFCCLLIAGSALIGSSESRASNASAGRSRIPSDPILVKQAILAHPDSEPVEALFFLYDSWNSKDSLRVLASFSNYYLGEAPGALYDCVVLRKGKAIRPYLEQQLRSSRDECMDEFGESRQSLCRPNERKEKINDLIRRIDAGERCSDAELAGSWGY